MYKQVVADIDTEMRHKGIIRAEEQQIAGLDPADIDRRAVPVLIIAVARYGQSDLRKAVLHQPTAVKAFARAAAVVIGDTPLFEGNGQQSFTQFGFIVG